MEPVEHFDKDLHSSTAGQADTQRLVDAIRAVHGPSLPVAAYSGGLPVEERERLEDALRDNEVKALVATSALGMGYDKPDLGFVVHYQSPGSPIAYYQQAFGAEVHHREIVESDGVEEALVKVADSYIQLTRATRPDSAIAKSIEKRGEGLHHVGYRVANCQEAYDAMVAAGAPRALREGNRLGWRLILDQSASGDQVDLVVGSQVADDVLKPVDALQPPMTKELGIIGRHNDWFFS